MDLSEDSGAFHTHSTNGGPLFEPDSSLSSSLCQTGSGRTITLQLLEFKTLLLEVVEELQIQRDAKTLFEDQISKLVLEKQELEWEKESLQHQAKTMANQHTEVLMNTQKQFQAKIRSIEEVKEKHQVIAELKEKEMTNLKEELKSLQLLKYNLEKKAVQLEQKIALQCRSKDSHLNQLGEVEKRFSALLRQCNTVKQAHEKLEQNVDDAMKMNTKLTSANGRHVSTIESLQKELAEVGDKLCKATMVTFKHDQTQNLTTTERSIQQLHLKLNMETEINKKLQKDNLAVRAEKQEVMRSLQHTQQLLLNQTQAVNKVEMELQTQKEQNQALKQEHDMMQEENKAMENNAGQLMESSTVTKTSWDKKKQSLNHPNQPSPTSMEEIIGKEILSEPISISEPPALQHLTSDQTKTRNLPENTEPTQAASGETEGQNIPNHHQHFLMNQQPNPQHSSTRQPANHNRVSLSSPHGTAGSRSNTDINHFSTRESAPDAVSDLLYTSSSATEDARQISETVSCCVSDTSTVPCSDQKSNNESSDGDKRDEADGRMMEKNQRMNNDVKEGTTSREECKTEQHDVEEEETSELKRGMIINQTTDRQEGSSQQPAEDTGGSKLPDTDTRDMGEGGRTDGTNQRDTTEPNKEQTVVRVTTEPTTEDSNFMDAEPPLTASRPSDDIKSLSQKDCQKDADKVHVNTEIIREQHISSADESQCVNHSTNSVVQELRPFCQDEVKSSAEEESTLSEQNKSHPCGLLGHLSCPAPMRTKQGRVPLLITSGSDPSSASCVSGTSASIKSHQQGESATADVERRASLSTSFPVSTSSSRLPCQTSPLHGRAPPLTAGLSSVKPCEPSCSSAGTEHLSFRAQLSKIEQFLNADRLHLHKRQRTDK